MDFGQTGVDKLPAMLSRSVNTSQILALSHFKEWYHSASG